MSQTMQPAMGGAQFTYDVNRNTFFRKDANNYINELSIKQLNTLDNVSLLDIYLSRGNVVEPHYHQNAAELVYCICGCATVSILNPYTKEIMNYTIGPGQVANVPQGWWHYEMATVDGTHLLAIFNAPVPEFIGGSDLFRLTPANVLAHTYCLDEAKVKETFAPIRDTVFIGPPAGCHSQKCGDMSQAAQHAAPHPAYYPLYPDHAVCNQGYGYYYR